MIVVNYLYCKELRKLKNLVYGFISFGIKIAGILT
jgi:hypothetical protein